MDADGNKTALPAQGAFYKPGGVGVPLDMATRLSAAGALTWWHLDDCGEFVFQVGLPIDRDAAPRAGTNPMRRKDGGELLGPTGKPVCKLFVFASREDYEWIAQDGVMNQTMKQTALDLFDTPTHYLPSELELTEPYSSAPLESEKGAKFEAGVTGGGVSGGDTRRTRAKLPTFWVAPLECGGCPLLSPPNWIHCVLTVRDCVMVEERRLSLAFLDEVLYFQRRMTRWCEPPVQYRFIREDLTDENRCAAHVVAPLLRMLSGTSIAARCRARNSLKTLTSPDAGYATSDKTRAEIVDALTDFETWLASARRGGVQGFHRPGHARARARDAAAGDATGGREERSRARRVRPKFRRIRRSAFRRGGAREGPAAVGTRSRDAGRGGGGPKDDARRGQGGFTRRVAKEMAREPRGV